jgi:hypothetical protein
VKFLQDIIGSSLHGFSVFAKHRVTGISFMGSVPYPAGNPRSPHHDPPRCDDDPVSAVFRDFDHVIEKHN